MPSNLENGSDVGRSSAEVERRGSAGKSSMKTRKKAKRGENLEPGSETRKSSRSTSHISVAENGQATHGEKKTDKKNVKTEAPDLMKRGQAPSVPCTWRTSDLNRNIKELETKVKKQKDYIKVQEETIKRNDQLLQNMSGMKQEPRSAFTQCKDEIGKLGEETGGYDTEIKFYNSLVETSDISNKMAEEAYFDKVKFSKSLQRTLTLLQDKTKKLHDNQEVAEMKKTIKLLHKERDREEYLMEKLMWYQEKVQECKTSNKGSIVETETVIAKGNNKPSNKNARIDMMEGKPKGNFSGNNVCVLPSIDKAGQLATTSSNKTKHNSRRPALPRVDDRCRLPSIDITGKSKKGLPVPPLDLSFLLESDEEGREKSPVRRNLVGKKKSKVRKAGKSKLPSIDINQNVTESKHVPSPPKSPRKTSGFVRKIRSFFGWK